MCRSTLLLLAVISSASSISVAADQTARFTVQRQGRQRVQPPVRSRHYERHEFTVPGDGQDKLTYYLMKPASYDAKQKYPLVLALHGRGGNTTAAAVLGGDEMRKQYPCFVMAPMSPRPATWAARPGSGRKGKLPAVFSAVEAVVKEFSIDPARIYVTGQSMGGFGSFGAVAARPDLFAAAVPICGGWLPQQAKQLAPVPFWVFHGADDNVVPVANSQKIVQALKDAGATPKYTEYPGVKHNSWSKAYATAEMWKWLFSQRRPGK